MNDVADVAAAGAGKIAVSGPMVFATVSDLLAASKGLFDADGAVMVDLRQVTNVDSAGLALLLEWLRLGKTVNRAVSFTGLPEKLVAIARLSGVDELLTAGYSPS